LEKNLQGLPNLEGLAQNFSGQPYSKSVVIFWKGIFRSSGVHSSGVQEFRIKFDSRNRFG
jgi:hypothetical protein